MDDAAPESVSAIALTATMFLACYTHTVDLDLSAVVCTVSGLDITFGAPYRRAALSAHNIQGVALTSALAVCTYTDDATPPFIGPRAVALTVSGTDITFGTSSSGWTTGTGTCLGVAALTSTTFIQIIRAASFTNRGRAMVGTVVGSAIMFGVFAAFSEADNGHPIGDFGFVAALDSTHVVVVYRSMSGDRAIVGVVSGTTVSFGMWTWTTFKKNGRAATFDANAENCRVAALDSTRFLVAYTENGKSDRLGIRVGTLSGGQGSSLGAVITFGALLEIGSGVTIWHGVTALAALSPTKAVVVAEQFQTTPDTIDAYVLTVSGTAVAAGAKTTVSTATTTNLSMALCALDASTVLLAYGDTGGAYAGTAQVGTVSGTDITFGAATSFSAGDTIELAACRMTATTAVVCYNASDNNGYARVLTVSGTTVTFGAAASFETDALAVAYVSVAGLDSARFAVAYFDDPRGYLRVGTVAAGAISFGAANEFLNNNSILLVKLALIGTDRLALAYGVSTMNSFYMECAVSGYSVSFGAATEWYAGGVPFGASGNSSTGMAAVGGQAVAAYRDGTLPGPGRAAILSSRAAATFKCEALDSTHFVAAVLEGGVIKVWAVAVSGASMAFSPPRSANSGAASDGWMNGQTVARLSAGKFVVVYTDTASGRCRAQVFTTSSARPTVNSPIGAGAAAVGGTGVNGSAIEVYVNDLSVGAADGVVSGGAWAKTSMPVMSAGDRVRAKQTEPGKLKSGFSNTVWVSPPTAPLYWAGWSYPQTWLGGFSLPVAGPMSVCALDSTHIVVLWRDSNGDAKVRAGFLNYGVHITWGIVETIAAARAAESVSIVALTATKFLACYTDASGGGGTLWAAAGEVFGDTDVIIQAVDNYTFHSDVTHIQCAALAPDLAVCTYKRDPTSPTALYAISVTVSGEAIAFNGSGPTFFTVTSGSFGFVTRLTSTTFVHMHRTGVGTGVGKAVVGIVTGGDISYGTAVGFTGTNIIGNYGFVCALDATHFVVAYEDASDSSKAKVAVGAVSGTTVVSFGAPVVLYASAVTKLKCEALDSARFVVAAYDAGGQIRTWVGTVTGVAVTFGYATTPPLAGHATDAGAWLSGQTLARLHGDSPAIVYSDSEDSVSNTYPSYIEPLSANRCKVMIGNVSDV
jgi:hypothetical protein